MKYIFLISVIILFILGIIFLKPVPGNPPPQSGTGVDADITIYQDPVEEPGPDTSEIMKKLDSIMIEHMEFEDTTIPAVVKALRNEARSSDPDKKGVNIVLLWNPLVNRGFRVEEDLDEGEFMLDDLETLPGVEDEEAITTGERTITIMFDDLSLGEAIRNICIAAEMKYRVEEHAVIMSDKDFPFDTLETRIYPVDSEAEFGGDEAGGGGSTVSVKGFFERQGIHFPDGAEIVYDDAISRLIATNTPDQLSRIETVIDELNVVDPQVLVTMRLLKIPDREFRKLRGKKALPVWDQVIQSDKTEILSTASVVTQNGEEATVRMVSEVYFPDTWGECSTSASKTASENKEEEEDDDLGLELGSEDENENSENSDEEEDDEEEETETETEIEEEAVPPNGGIITFSSMPEFAEPTELGTRLTVTPTVDPDKYTVTLDMIPVIQHFSGWTGYGNNIKMEIIKAFTATSQVTLYDRDTVPLGFAFEDVGKKSGRERNRFMMLVTATLLNPDGTPLRNKAGGLNPLPKKRRRPPVKNKKKGLYTSKYSMEKLHTGDGDIANIVDYLNMEFKRNENINIVLGLDEAQLEQVPSVNLDLRDIPYHEIIRYLCMVTGLKYRLDGNTIIIGESVGDMDTSFFKVRSALIARVAPDSGSFEEDVETDENRKVLKSFVSMQGVYLPKGSSVSYDPKTGRYTVDTTDTRFEDYETPASSSTSSEALRNYFRDRGISFPPGSAIYYSRRSGKLTVKNTDENLRRLDTLLRALDIEQPQVVLETTIVEISHKDLISLIGKKAALSDNLSKAQIHRIIDSEKGRILSSQTVIAKNGEEANVRLVDETYYPDTWSSPEVTSSEGFLQEIASVPEFSESTDIGSSLTFTPTVSPDNNTISLSLSPQFIDFEGWSYYPQSYRIAMNGKVRTGKTNLKMAIRGRKDLNVNVKIYDGDTIQVARTQQIDISEKNNRSFDYVKSWTEMLGDAKSQKEELKNVFFFIKANIINPDGEFVRE